MRWTVEVQVPTTIETKQSMTLLGATLRTDDIEADELRIENGAYRFTKGNALVAAYQADGVVRAVSDIAALTAVSV